MTSSRRSSAASSRRSSLAVPRKTAQVPSVSFVYAEPEQSSPPSGSAAARLSPRVSLQTIQAKDIEEEDPKNPEEGETVTGKQMDVDGSVEGASEVRETRAADSASELRIQDTQQQIRVQASLPTRSWFPFRQTPSKRSLTVSGGTQSTSSPADAPLTESPKIIPEQLTISPEAVEETMHAPHTPPIPIKLQGEGSRGDGYPAPSQGWFGSLSKTQGKVTQLSPDKNQAVIDSDCDQLSHKVCTNTDTRASSIEPQQTSGHSIWFTPQNPSSSQADRVPSTPSSLDVKTPTESGSPPHAKQMPELGLISSHRPEAKLSALNPSSSRFTLSMPLLGRPKVPLSTVISRTDDEKSIVPFSPSSEIDGGILPGPPSSPPSASPPPPSNASANEVSMSVTRPDPDPDVNTVSLSWWSYIGLGGKAEASSQPPPSELPNQQNEENATSNEDPGIQPVLQASEQQVLDQRVGIAFGSPPTTSNGTEDIDQVSAERPLSVTSGQTSASAWYSPWGWYEWYATPGVLETPEATVASITEADQVKEEALARPDPPDTSSASPSVQEPEPSASAPEASTESINPIISSLAANSRGWASFFSSRALTTKTVTENGEVKNDGMEVMDIDDDAGEMDTASVTTSYQVQESQALAAVASSDGKSAVKKTPLLKETGSASSKPGTTIAVPLTSSESVKRRTANGTPERRSASPTPSGKSIKPAFPPTPRAPNLVLPTFSDTFGTLPRSRPSPLAKSSTAHAIKKTMGFVTNVLFAREQDKYAKQKGKETARRAELDDFGKELPRAWKVLNEVPETHSLSTCKKVVVIGIHGWFPGYAMRTVLGEPTGTSAKFANMMELAVEAFAEKYGMNFEEITKIPLEGEGKIEHRVQKLYRNLTSNDGWVEALHDADVIFVATHSQGSIVSTHLISQLIADGHIRTAHKKTDAMTAVAANVASGSGGIAGMPPTVRNVQRICCLALCGIHLGPLAYLQKSSFLMPYIQYFESEAATELFEFQHTESQVSKEYVKAVRHVLDHGVKLVYIASLNDQVVPVYSGAFTSVTHPLILRALYIDGDAYNSSDFLSNLLVLLLRIRNAGLSDGGLLAHLSEATAGSLNGVGHSTAYEELATYSLAVDYLFLVNDGCGGPHELAFESFNARDALNDYEIPWALRDLIADERIVYLFSKEFSELRDAFNDWHPRTTILRDLKRKLEPIRRLKLASRL
ncbi:hypothetical protein M0805_004945 [Coniferiporia weirii]|nr:hypothetical protein M0805_004945 [Coniferiporia weirii]